MKSLAYVIFILFLSKVWFQEYARLKLCLAQIKCLGVNTRKDLNEANYKCKYTPGSLLHFSSLLGLGVDRISDLIGIYIPILFPVFAGMPGIQSDIWLDIRYPNGYIIQYPVCPDIWYSVQHQISLAVFILEHFGIVL